MMDVTPHAAGAATILVVDDRPELLDAVEQILERHGYRVHTALDGETGLTAALELQPDLVILDVGLPMRSGLHVARDLRARAFRAPMLMLTAAGTVTDKVSGFDAGADDYLAKPFDNDELLARVKALLRRSALRADDAVLRVGDLKLDPVSREVARGGRRVSLTQRECSLLEYLMRHAGRPVSRDQICENVWKQPFDPSTNIVDVYVNYLRTKLGDDEATLLRTLRGVGYLLEATPAIASPPLGEGLGTGGVAHEDAAR